MMTQLKIAAVAFWFMVSGFAPARRLTERAVSPPVTVLHMEEDILHYVNLDRRSRGLKPLRLNNTESALALQHSKNMAMGKTPFGHKGLEARANSIRKKVGPIEVA